ncbi:hypothetical protein M409DRAFT_29514 [Zasmidium cellare ATCC 36951]|uniref:Uncharacterized protein n=1 Tax=Zasmidium cellare ATCC 36951 TaxID=1080233 RepID=A0A6A6BZ38_ZASCE|nr:uncharacterized protein M409DRAFT_29514 [Zasmidium cellare ATCC 36951]KAF2160067.1 hypothetical protein M409DRAFT_29514 [Zasmidium cellare ATCC 36951]
MICVLSTTSYQSYQDQRLLCVLQYRTNPPHRRVARRRHIGRVSTSRSCGRAIEDVEPGSHRLVTHVHGVIGNLALAKLRQSEDFDLVQETTQMALAPLEGERKNMDEMSPEEAEKEKRAERLEDETTGIERETEELSKKIKKEIGREDAPRENEQHVYCGKSGLFGPMVVLDYAEGILYRKGRESTLYEAKSSASARPKRETPSSSAHRFPINTRYGQEAG